MKNTKNKTLFYTFNAFIALGFAAVAVMTVYFGNSVLQKGSLSGLYNEKRPVASEDAVPVAATSTPEGTLSLAQSGVASATTVAAGTGDALVGSWNAQAWGGDVTVKNLCIDVNPFPGNAKQLGASEVTHAKVLDLVTQEVLFESKVVAAQFNGECEILSLAKAFVVQQGAGRSLGLFIDVSEGAPAGAKFMPLLGLENATPSFVTAGEIMVK